MEKYCYHLVAKLVESNMISVDEADVYSYNLQIVIESFISHLLLLCIALVLGRFLEVIIFIIVFGCIRSFASGFHCNSAICCNALSIALTILLIVLEQPIKNYQVLYLGGVILSMLFVIRIGSVNHPNMNWSENELARAKKYSRILVSLFTMIFLFLSVLVNEMHYTYYIGCGIVISAVTLALQLIVSKGGVLGEEG